MTTDDWIRLISTLGFPIVVAIIMLLGTGYIVGWIVWPWATKQYEQNRTDQAAQTKLFAETLTQFNVMLEKRDEQRHLEHTNQMQLNAKQQQDFLNALSQQRFEFLQGLAKRDDATINIVNALDELTKETKALSNKRRGES